MFAWAEGASPAMWAILHMLTLFCIAQMYLWVALRVAARTDAHLRRCLLAACGAMSVCLMILMSTYTARACAPISVNLAGMAVNMANKVGSRLHAHEHGRSLTADQGRIGPWAEEQVALSLRH